MSITTNAQATAASTGVALFARLVLRAPLAAALYEVKTISTLTKFDLNQNSIGDQGALALSEALKTNSTSVTSNLKNNSIGGKGAQALSKALKTNTTVTILDLQNNKIGDIGLRALSEARKASPSSPKLSESSCS
ncbi:hypothetical protein BGZ82_001546 [Podila clonocystis]|nr:hypothetical protein BGZ82_001546 [Podila clonocystis]